MAGGRTGQDCLFASSTDHELRPLYGNYESIPILEDNQ